MKDLRFPAGVCRPGAFGRARRRASAAAVAALVVLPLAACGGGDGPTPPPTPSAAIPVTPASGLTGIVGQTLRDALRVRVTDGSGKAVAGASVTWSATAGQLSPSTSTTGADGVAESSWTLGTSAVEQVATATVAGSAARVEFRAVALADRPAAVRLTRDTSALVVPGAAVSLTAMVVDKYGNAVASPGLQWTASDTAVAVVDASGTLRARSPGTVTVTAASDTARGALTVRIESLPALRVTRANSDTLRPGSVLTIEGTGFLSGTNVTTVTLAGATVTPSVVTATTIVVPLPVGGAFPCLPSGAVPLVVRRSFAGAVDTSSTTALLPGVPGRSLGVGESVTLTAPGDVRCTRLDAAGRYLVSVFNTSESPLSSTALEVRGIPATLTASAAAALEPSAARIPVRSTNLLPAGEQRAAEADVEHVQHLEEERALVARLGAPLPASGAARGAGGPQRSVGVAAGRSVGDTVSVNAMYSSCNRSTPIRARVVYSGTRAVVLEDLASPSAHTLDDQYRAVGDEFDRVQFPIVTTEFGDPLAMDAKLANDGRVTMLFTRYVNDSVPTAVGYVTACNFYSRTQLATSNQAPVFYARVPQFNAAGTTESPDQWRRSLRATVIHETKHLAAYAEKFARAGTGVPNLEEGWLEESTARVVEEIYARTFSGARWRGGAPYATTVGCELTQRCDDRPLAMWKHFSVLADYMTRVDSLSPVGPSSTFDATYYASGWSLVRWATDQYAGSDEAAFLRSIVAETSVTGLANLARRTGRPTAEMLADWTLALGLANYPTVTPRRAQATFPSWNLRDVFAGLNAYNRLDPRFARPWPLLVRTASAGSFAADIAQLRGFSAAYVEIGGTWRGPQLVEVRGRFGSAPPSTVGVSIVRVE